MSNFENSSEGKRLLKAIGLRIQNDLYKQERSVEDLSLDCGVARSTLREIIAGRSNPRLMTLHSVAVSLGYTGVADFLTKVEKRQG